VALLSLAVIVAVASPLVGGGVGQVERYRPYAERWGRAYGIDPDLILAVAAVESGGDPRARSHRDARGLMQVMPATAREVAGWLELDGFDLQDLEDPETCIRLGTRYLAWLAERFGHDRPRTILVAYNAGYGRATTWRAAVGSGEQGSDVALLDAVDFPETRIYVERVLAAWARLREGRRR
jgi:soluble lytic murein transglycosylase